jgi:hypothetical protein
MHLNEVVLFSIGLLLVGCVATKEAPPHDPWEVGAETGTPYGCKEWRKRDPEANC